MGGDKFTRLFNFTYPHIVESSDLYHEEEKNKVRIE
jgi:hypothetical protein